MRSLKASVGRQFLVVLTLACSVGLALGKEPAESERPRPSSLAPVAERLKAIMKDLPAVSMAERREFVKQVAAAFAEAAGPDGKGITLEDISPLIECEKWLTSCDFGDRQAEIVICQKMSMAGLALGDQLPIKTEMSLLRFLDLGRDRNVNAQGQLVTGAEFQALRNQVIVHRLRPRRRIELMFDPNWDPQDYPYSNTIPAQFGLPPGITPQRIKDPKVRAQYEAALALTKRNSRLHHEQRDASRLLEDHLRMMRRRIPAPYGTQPVTLADIEQLEANLHAYVGDEQVRRELLTSAVCAASYIGEPLPEEDPAPDLFETELDEIKQLSKQGKADAVAQRMDLMRARMSESQPVPAGYVEAARRAIREFVYSPVRESEKVRESAGRLGLDAIQATKTLERAEIELRHSQLILATMLLSKTSVSAEQVATVSLDAWMALVAAINHYAPFDPRNPQLQAQIPDPPTGFKDWFSVSQSPIAKQGSALRKRYDAILSLRIKVMQNGGKFRELTKIHDKFYPYLKGVLREAYSGSPQKEQAGMLALVEHVSDVKVREDLIESLSAAAIKRDRQDYLDRRHDESSAHWVPSSHARPRKGEPKLSVPAPKGAMVVRGPIQTDCVKLLSALAIKFKAENKPQEKLSIASDRYSSYGRLCDEDAPFDVVIVEGERTYYDRNCSRRFSSRGPFPQEYFIGQMRVVLIVHNSNPIGSINFAKIARAFGPYGKETRWLDLGGEGSAAPRAYGLASDSWASLFLQTKCMRRLQDVKPRVMSLRKLEFRSDLVACGNARELISKVSQDSNGIGFVAWESQLTAKDFRQVKVLSVAVRNEPAVAASLDVYAAKDYPLRQRVSLHAHPNSPALANKYCRFATSPAGAAVAEQFGVLQFKPWQLAPGRETLGQMVR